jgi:hypothetical protein
MHQGFTDTGLSALPGEIAQVGSSVVLLGFSLSIDVQLV